VTSAPSDPRDAATMIRALPGELRAASARRYLRGNLPAVYSESPHRGPPPVMGMLEGFEQVLDPLVILLDNLVSHLQPATAPAELLDFLMEMTGAPVDRTLSLQRRRKLAIHAARIARGRGTKTGLQLALEDALPDLEPKVLDNGRATWGPRERARSAGKPGAASSSEAPRLPSAGEPRPPSPTEDAPVPQQVAPAFEVELSHAPTALQREQLARCVADHLPVGASSQYRVAGA
jgi:phage tail-like protein